MSALFAGESLIIILSCFLVFRIGNFDTVYRLMLVLMLSGSIIAGKWAFVKNCQISLFMLMFVSSSFLMLVQSVLRIAWSSSDRMGQLIVCTIATTATGYLAPNSTPLETLCLLSLGGILFHSVILSTKYVSHMTGARTKLFLIGLTPFHIVAVIGQYTLASCVAIVTLIVAYGVLHATNHLTHKERLIMMWPPFLIAITTVFQIATHAYESSEYIHIDSTVASNLLNEGEYFKAIQKIRTQSGGHQLLLQHLPDNETIRNFSIFFSNSTLLIHAILAIAVLAYQKILFSLKQYSRTIRPVKKNV